jgi:hypothetical protein
LLAALALLAGFFAVNRFKMENLMKKSLFGLASAITILASGSVSAQTSMNGPYYANPSWDQQLPAAQRFIVLSNWNNEAVLDRETGLVWERQPVSDKFDWFSALVQCRPHLTGNRRGWRLPSYEELTSLIDGTQSNPALPTGHPFLGVGASDVFWTASQYEPDVKLAWTVNFFDLTNVATAVLKTPGVARFWCVRGGSATANPPF